MLMRGDGVCRYVDSRSHESLKGVFFLFFSAFLVVERKQIFEHEIWDKKVVLRQCLQIKTRYTKDRKASQEDMYSVVPLGNPYLQDSFLP